MMNKERYIIKYPTGITITDVEPAEVTIKRQKEIIDELEERIDKAIEYTKKQLEYSKKDCVPARSITCEKLLEILGGKE